MKKTIATIMSVTCLLLSSICLSGCSKVKTDKDGKLIVNFDYDCFNDKNYKKVREKFLDYGFKNIVVEFMGNLDDTNNSKEGTLSNIQIKDSLYFKKGSTFSCYDPVLLYVNSNKKDMEVEFEEKDGMIPYPFDLFDFENYDIKEAECILKNMGFTDVDFYPVMQSYIKETDAQNGKINFVKVDGEKPFPNPGYVNKDATIELQYDCVPGLYCLDGLPHSLVDEPAIESTCSTPGRTAGKRCTRCNEFIQGGYSTLCKEHEYENDTTGSKICKNCHAEYVESEVEIAESIDDLICKKSVTNEEIKAFCKANIGKEVSFSYGDKFVAKIASEESESKSKYEFSYVLYDYGLPNNLNGYKIIVQNTKNIEQFPLNESFDYWYRICWELLMQNFYIANGYRVGDRKVFVQEVTGEILDYNDDSIFISFSSMEFEVENVHYKIGYENN